MPTSAAAWIAGGSALVGLFQSNKASSAQNQIASQQLYESAYYRDIWERYYRACELAHAEDICARERAVPRYASTRNRMLVQTRRAFSEARQELIRCASVMCCGALNEGLTRMAIAEANAQVEMTDRAHRYEEERATLLNAQLDDLLYRTHQLGRGMIVNASAAGELAARAFGQQAQGNAALAGYGLSRLARAFDGNNGGGGGGTGTTNVNVTTQSPVVNSSPSPFALDYVIPNNVTFPDFYSGADGIPASL